MKHTVLPDGQSTTVAFTVLARLCGPKANETEMGVALFTKNGEGRALALVMMMMMFFMIMMIVMVMIMMISSFCKSRHIK